jgi:hypothetical protein
MTSAGGPDILQAEVNEEILASSRESKLSAVERIAEEKRQFWELQESISVISALALAYDEACNIAEIDKETQRDGGSRI